MTDREKREWEDQIAYNNAMDVRRMTPLLQRICAHTDHPDYEAAIDAIFNEIDRLQAENEKATKNYEQLRNTFEHTHVSNMKEKGWLYDDSCASCGLDLRNPIHIRLAALNEQK